MDEQMDRRKFLIGTAAAGALVAVGPSVFSATAGASTVAAPPAASVDGEQWLLQSGARHLGKAYPIAK